MEKTPTFALPNEFLIWVAAKFLVNCDLNLLLTEYYKEVLESRLKNRETWTHAHKNSAKSTDNSRLNLPTDCDKPSDLRPISYTLLTPPSSPIPAPLSIPNSPSISCTYLISPSSLTSQLSSDVKTSDCAKDSTNTAGTTVESSMDNTEGSTPTPSNSNASKESMPASIPVYSHAVMPYPGAPGTPFFEGSNVTDFLDRYSRMCTDYRVDEQEKIKRLSWYCEMFTGKYVETLISSSGTSWAALRKVLRDEYKDQDLNQQMNSRRFLETYKDKSRADTSDVLQYCRQFSAISQNLVAKGKLDSFTQSRWFLQGLPSTIQTEMFYRYELDPDDDLHMDFADLLKKALGLLGAKKKLVDLVRTDKKSDRIEDLVDKCEKKTRISSAANYSTPLPESAFQPPVATPIHSAYSSTADPRPVDRKIDQLTEMMQGLALSVRTLQSRAGISGGNPRTAIIPVIPGSSQPSGPTTIQRQDWPEGVTKCSYCWAADHYLKRHCSVFQEDLNSNRIHLGDDRKVCIGPYTPGARPVFMRREKPGRESVADAEKLRYPILPSAEVHTLRIGDLQPDPYSSDDEDEYVSLDAPLDVTVSAARSSQNKGSDASAKEPIKRVLRKRIQKEDNYAMPKNVRFGEWRPVENALPPPAPASVQKPSQEEVMTDSEPTVKKNVERKKHPRVVGVLKETVGATMITKRILDLGVNLTVGELLASAPAVEKQLTKAITEDEAVQFRVNTLGSGEILEAKKPFSWYSMGSPKAKVRLEDGSKITALLDTGAEINVMTREVMEDAGLAMRQGPKLELVSHTGHSRPFLGLCEDVEVAIGGLKTRHPIFVVEAGDHDLVLGQPFLNTVKFSQDYKPDGVFGSIIHPQTQESAIFRTLSPQDPANRTENHIFPQSLN